VTRDFFIGLDAPSWRKSSYSNGTGGNCIEVGTPLTHTPIRDSKDPHGPTLTFPSPAFAAFLTALRTNTLN
jgi:hypothetical protein